MTMFARYRPRWNNTREDLLTNMVLQPLPYRLHPVLAEAIPAEALYELKLNCKVSAAAHIRALLLSTITPTSRHVAFHPWGTERRERANPYPRRVHDRR